MRIILGIPVQSDSSDTHSTNKNVSSLKKRRKFTQEFTENPRVSQHFVNIERYGENAQGQVRNSQIENKQIVRRAHVFVDDDCANDEYIAEEAENDNNEEHRNYHFLLERVQLAIDRARVEITQRFKCLLLLKTTIRR